MFAPPNPNGMGGPPGPPPTYHIPPHYHQQPAPRQRTAIACRYCRRRKIRCSGFETSPDGRCANCMRFNQECVFTPVSSQTQAFVPAHALVQAGRSGGAAPQLYGPQGQPLPPGYGPQGLEYGVRLPPPVHNYNLPPPTGHLNGDHQHQQSSYMTPEDRNRPTLPPPPPPPPGHHQGAYGRKSSGDEYSSHYSNQPPSPSSHLHAPGHAYTPPSINSGPNSTYPPTTYGQGPPPPLPAVSGSYYPALPTASASQRPDSPGSHRSSSEHPSVSPQPQQTFHPPMIFPSRETSSGPSSPGGPIPSMQIAGLIDPPHPAPPSQHHQRSAADENMLNQLNSRTGL
jgi:hypothetical protein